MWLKFKLQTKALWAQKKTQISQVQVCLSLTARLVQYTSSYQKLAFIFIMNFY